MAPSAPSPHRFVRRLQPGRQQPQRQPYHQQQIQGANPSASLFSSAAGTAAATTSRAGPPRFVGFRARPTYQRQAGSVELDEEKRRASDGERDRDDQSTGDEDARRPAVQVQEEDGAEVEGELRVENEQAEGSGLRSNDVEVNDDYGVHDATFTSRLLQAVCSDKRDKNLDANVDAEMLLNPNTVPPAAGTSTLDRGSVPSVAAISYQEEEAGTTSTRRIESGGEKAWETAQKQAARWRIPREHVFEAVHSPKRRRLWAPSSPPSPSASRSGLTAIVHEHEMTDEDEEGGDQAETAEEEERSEKETEVGGSHNQHDRPPIVQSASSPSHSTSSTPSPSPSPHRARLAQSSPSAQASSRRFLPPRSSIPPFTTNSQTPFTGFIPTSTSANANAFRHTSSTALPTGTTQASASTLTSTSAFRASTPAPPARPSFLLPAQPPSPQSPTTAAAPPPDILSPSGRRGSARYQPGGLAATVRSWIIDVGQAATVAASAGSGMGMATGKARQHQQTRESINESFHYGLGIDSGSDTGLAFRMRVVQARTWVGCGVVLVEGTLMDGSDKGPDYHLIRKDDKGHCLATAANSANSASPAAVTGHQLKRMLLVEKGKGPATSWESTSSRKDPTMSQLRSGHTVAVRHPVWTIGFGSEAGQGEPNGGWTVGVDWAIVGL